MKIYILKAVGFYIACIAVTVLYGLLTGCASLPPVVTHGELQSCESEVLRLQKMYEQIGTDIDRHNMKCAEKKECCL